MNDHTHRFTGRATDYVHGRPGYPRAIVQALVAQGLPPAALVIDVGAGTGIASQLFLDHGHRVIAIEPNPDMRAVALAAGIDARPGRGEQTGLPAASADLVLCAQAFHWMDRPAAWAEFQRIAKPSALLALLWNQRVTTGTPFLEQLESLLHLYAADDPQVSEGDTLRQWPGTTLIEFRHTQTLDYPALLARVSSMSYMPRPATPALQQALRQLFDDTNQNGQVEMLYDARLYWARNS
jgi:SAM-dependent methyltransferase